MIYLERLTLILREFSYFDRDSYEIDVYTTYKRDMAKQAAYSFSSNSMNLSYAPRFVSFASSPTGLHCLIVQSILIKCVEWFEGLIEQVWLVQLEKYVCEKDERMSCT